MTVEPDADLYVLCQRLTELVRDHPPALVLVASPADGIIDGETFPVAKASAVAQASPVPGQAPLQRSRAAAPFSAK
jgi:hypothetical protein